MRSVRFFHQTRQAKLRIEEIQSPLGDVLAAGHSDQTGKVSLAEPLEHLLIRLRFDQNVSVSQKERTQSHETFCQFGRFARTVLNKLAAVSDADAPSFAVLKITLDDFRLIPSDDKDFCYACRDQTFDDVLQN